MSKPCQHRHRPLMHVDKKISSKRIDHFAEGKYKKLRTQLGKYDARYVLYEAPAFLAMIGHFLAMPDMHGLRIYFASYLPDGSDSVPVGYGKLMTLIFAPTTDPENPKNIGKYYTIFPKSPFSQLDKELAISWAKYYESEKLPTLNETVPGKQDTKSIYYERESIEDLKVEIECQRADGIKAYFCAMLEEDKFKHQLLLDFILTAKIGADHVDFYVQDRDGWADRPARGDLDTGSPCPPNHCNPEFP